MFYIGKGSNNLLPLQVNHRSLHYDDCILLIGNGYLSSFIVSCQSYWGKQMYSKSVCAVVMCYNKLKVPFILTNL